MTERARACAAALLLCVAAARAAPPEAAPPEAEGPDAAQESAGSGAGGGAGGAPLAAADPAAELRERLAAREHEVAALRGELERLKAKSAAAAAAPVAAMPAPPAGTPAAGSSADDAAAGSASPRAASGPFPRPSPPGVTAAAAGAPDVTPPLFAVPGTHRALPAWQAEIAAAGGALVLGFGLGWRTLDRRIRRKYGGLRIY